VITEVTDTTTPAEILLKVADVIETRGWYQSGYAPSDSRTDLSACPVCVLAALNVVTGHHPAKDFLEHGDDDPATKAAAALAEHLGLSARVAKFGLVDALGEFWNDFEAESAEQVITALRECAAQLQAGAK
jgi:hypothetical protein